MSEEGTAPVPSTPQEVLHAVREMVRELENEREAKEEIEGKYDEQSGNSNSNVLYLQIL